MSRATSRQEKKRRDGLTSLASRPSRAKFSWFAAWAPLSAVRGSFARGIPVWLVVAFALTGCGGDEDSLKSASHAQSQVVTLFWAMVAGSCIGFGAVALLLFGGWVRRHRRIGSESGLTALVIVLGVAVPCVILSALFVWADIFVVRSTAAPPPGSTQMTVRVIAHDWWWEVRYPGTTAVTANEIHIPTDTRVEVVGTTSDVIHSFWVPELNRKIDLIPGRTGSILLDATRPGVYRGQCSEFCGVQHAHMTVAVVAEPAAAFHAWLADAARGAAAPATPAERQGKAVFLAESCASCHTIRGTAARGRVGPDLTHLATRIDARSARRSRTRAAYLRGWIANPQRVKPGAKMPSVALTRRQLDALTAYLEHLH